MKIFILLFILFILTLCGGLTDEYMRSQEKIRIEQIKHINNCPDTIIVHDTIYDRSFRFGK
jgi:hypothetical protein